MAPLFLFLWVGFAGTARSYRRCRISRERAMPAMLLPREFFLRLRGHSDAGAWERSIPFRIPRHEVERWPRQADGSGHDGFPGKKTALWR